MISLVLFFRKPGVTVGLCHSFIKHFSHIARPLTSFLAKDVPFEFDNECLNAFQTLKKALISAPIIQPP
jgi:hypothetical protein